MTTRELMQALCEAGVSVVADEGRLRCSPASALTPSLREAIVRHRDGLLRLLTRSASPDPLPPPPDPALPYALSHPQQRIWFLDQLAGAQAAYVIPAAAYVRGALDVMDLQRAIAVVADRHDALRTAFSAVEGEPMQAVHDHVAIELPVISLEDLSPEHRREEAERRTSDVASAPFDLGQPPLFRTRLFRLSAQEHLWVLCIHHLIADGTSLRVLLNDVLDVYSALRRGEVVPQPARAATYGTFVAWQRDRLESDAATQMTEYWRGALNGVTPLNLMTDRPRTATRDPAGAAEVFTLEAALSERLRRLARTQGSSLYAVLLAAFQVLMARCAGQRDIAIGTAMANRARPEFEQLVGCLANTVVIRCDVDPDLPFADLLSAVQERIRGAWSHQEMPFERVVEHLKQREAGRNPVFDVFFALNVPIAASTLAGLRIEPIFVRPQAAKFELALFCEDSPDGLRALLEYQTDVWDRQTIQRLAALFVTLLGGIADAPTTTVGGLPMLDAAQQTALRDRQRASVRPFSEHACVHDLVAAQARRTPQAVAASFEGRLITYAELDRRSSLVARRLQVHGAGPGRLIGLAFERSLEMLVALLGILKSGAAYVPFDTAFPADRLRFIADDSGIAAVLTTLTGPSSELLQIQCCAVVPDSTPRLLLEDLEAPEGPDPIATAAARVSPVDLAYVLYTSGSTGSPKGVEVTHRSVVNFLESMAREPGLADDDVLLAVTTLSFDIAVLELFLPWVVGARVVLASRETAGDGQRLAEALAACRATVMQATPSTWRMLVEAGFRPGPDLKVLCGGEALSASLAADLTASGAEVWNLYGPTETTVWSAVARVRPGRPPDLGSAIGNTWIYVLDPAGQPVPVGVAGEICIGGVGVARGYRHRPELTAQRFVADPNADVSGARMYRTGDRGAFGNDGALRFLGRLDHQLKVRGFRVEPAEIEAALARHADVQQAVVVGQRGAGDDTRLLACVRCDPDHFSPESFRRFLSDRLPSYMLPAVFARIDEWPMTPNGKVDRAALSALSVDASSVPRASALVPPRDDLEAQVADIWRQVLGVDDLGVRDGFFELGGHSLLAARVVSRVESALGVRLPISLFTARPTVEEHARFIADERRGREERRAKLLDWVESLSEEDAVRYLKSQ